MKIDLSGRTAVVTGGTAGIGLAAVRLFLEAGAQIAFCDSSRIAWHRSSCRSLSEQSESEIERFAHLTPVLV